MLLLWRLHSLGALMLSSITAGFVAFRLRHQKSEDGARLVAKGFRSGAGLLGHQGEGACPPHIDG